MIRQGVSLQLFTTAASGVSQVFTYYMYYYYYYHGNGSVLFKMDVEVRGERCSNSLTKKSL